MSTDSCRIKMNYESHEFTYGLYLDQQPQS